MALSGSKSGWWFQTFFVVHFIYGMSSFPLTNSIIFQSGRYTTNQKWYKADPCICPKRAFAHDVSQNWLQEPWGSCNLSHRKFCSFFKPTIYGLLVSFIWCFKYSILIVNYQFFIVYHSLFRLKPTHRVIKLLRFLVEAPSRPMRLRRRRQHIGCLWRSAGPVVCWISSKDLGMLGKTTYTIWLFNIAMGNGPFIEVYLLKMVIFHGYVK